MPEQLPALRRRRREARRRGHAPLPEPRLPVARPRDADQLGHGRHGHRGRRRAVRPAPLERGPPALDARSLPAHRGAAAGARRLRRDLRAERDRRDRRVEGTAVLARPLRAQHPRRRLGDGAEPRAPLRHVDRLLEASQEDIQEVDGIGPDRAEAIAEWFSDEREPHARRRSCARSGCGSRRGGGAADRGAADGQPVRDHRHARGASRARRRRRRSKRTARRCRDNVSKKTTGVVVGENPGSKAAKAEKAGVPVLSESDLRELVKDAPKTSQPATASPRRRR